MSLLRNIFSTKHGSLPKAVLSARGIWPVLTSLNSDLRHVVLMAVNGESWLSKMQKAPVEEVYLFEPEPAAYHRLKRTFPQFNCRQGALSDRVQVDSYIHYLDSDGKATQKLNGLKDQVNILVKSQPLQAVWPAQLPLDLLVIDRGFTPDKVLKGAEPILSEHHPMIVFQWSAYATATHAEATWALLQQLGYHVWPLHKTNGTPLSQAAFMALPKGPILAMIR